MLSLPRTDLPSVNAPSSLTRNQVPNSSAFVRARHTRVRGARSTTRFSIRSVLTVSFGASALTAIARSSPETGRKAILRYATFVLRIIPATSLKRNPHVALPLVALQSEATVGRTTQSGRRDLNPRTPASAIAVGAGPFPRRPTPRYSLEQGGVCTATSAGPQRRRLASHQGSRDPRPELSRKPPFLSNS